jgi:Glycosyl transferase family 2
MRIALFNAFPCLPFSAEKEFIQRCRSIFATMEHDAHEVCTSGEVIRLNPDLILATHDLVPKLTEHFTVGVLWHPTHYYSGDAERLKNIASWDLIVPINERTRAFGKVLQFSLQRPSAVTKNILHPSSHIIDVKMPDVHNLTLAYMGTQWDTGRHYDLLQRLSETLDLNIYGPSEAWTHFPQAYRGSIPANGRAVIDTLNQHGAVLALHKDTHCAEDTPSMRVFEGCAAKCLVITDRMLSLRQVFGNSLEYVDLVQDPMTLARQIATIVQAARQNTKATMSRIESAHRIFCERASLDVLLPPLVNEISGRISTRRRPITRTDLPTVSIIVRCGTRSLSMLRRAVRSLCGQLYPEIAVIFVYCPELDGFTKYVDALRASGRFRSISIAHVAKDACRSTALWRGLQEVQTPFFGVLDDDDELFPDHLQHIMEVFQASPEADLVYSGGIRHEEETRLEHLPPRLRRPDGSFVEETRALAFFSPFDEHRLLNGENMILSHAFVARSRFLSGEILQDPKLGAAEDMYLYLLLAAHGARFRFNGRASVVYNLRSRSRDNSLFTIGDRNWKKASDRIYRRLAGYAFPSEIPGQLSHSARGFTALAAAKQEAAEANAKLAAAKQEAAEANAKLAAAKLMIERLDAENAAYRRSRVLRLWKAIRGVR